MVPRQHLGLPTLLMHQKKKKSFQNEMKSNIFIFFLNGMLSSVYVLLSCFLRMQVLTTQTAESKPYNCRRPMATQVILAL